jgi:myosin heavy subunit
MSTLSKVFVILVFLVALVKLGVDATLFAQRVDWKDKFVKEVNYHYQTQQIKNAEIQDLVLQRENLNEYKKILEDKINMLDIESAAKSQQIANLQRQFDAVDGNFKKLIADVDVFVRQLEVQITQITEMSNKVEDYRQKLVKAAAEKSTAVQELQYARQEAEVLQKSLAGLEENHVVLARDKKRLEETIKALNDRGIDTDLVTPKKLLEGKVTAVSTEIGLVVISIGRDDGVLEGNEFTIYRGGQFIAKITIDRVDRKWSAGRVTLKKDDPRVSDDASNSIFVSSFKNQ